MTKKFDDALTVLLLSQPFFGTLLMKMKHVASTDLPTAAVSSDTLFYNPEWFNSMEEEEVVFVLAHEVMHQAWQHLPRLKHYLDSGVGPDGKNLDVQLFGAAMDFPLNASLVTAGIGKMPKIGCLDAHRFPEDMTPEEVYCILKKDQEQNGGRGNSGRGDGKPEAMDGHDASDVDKPGALTPADVLQAAENHRAIRGSYPVGMERLLGELKKPEISPWRKLRNFIVKSLPGFDATSWRRLQRRLIVRRIGVPGRVAVGAGKVGVIVDTSGSIGQDVLNVFGGHMASIIEDAMPELLRVYWVDARVHRIDDVKNGTQLRALLAKPVPGGGGTDMRKGIQAAEIDKCDAIVVLTDGYTPFCGSTKPLMWAITSHNIKAPSGTTIHI
jgi:predicted metal-dependent peptidase